MALVAFLWVQGLGFRVQGSGFRFRVQGSGFRLAFFKVCGTLQMTLVALFLNTGVVTENTNRPLLTL